jgi:hypothetical protein
VNSVWNGSRYIKRKKADHYVSEKRGRYVDAEHTQFLLDMTDAANIALSRKAAAGYNWAALEFQWRPGVSGGATVVMTENRSTLGRRPPRR